MTTVEEDTVSLMDVSIRDPPSGVKRTIHCVGVFYVTKRMSASCELVDVANFTNPPSRASGDSR